MEGSSCEVNLQTLLPHSGGTTGLSLEQNFSHQVLLLLSGSDHSLRQNPAGSREFSTAMKEAAFRQLALELASFPSYLLLYSTLVTW